MKNKILIFLFLGFLVTLVACEPMVEDDIDLGATPNIESIDYKVAFNEASGEGTFEVENTGVVAVWYFPSANPDNPTIVTGNKIVRSFSKRGSYDAQLSVYNKAGMSEKTSFSFEAPGAPLPAEAEPLLDRTWMWDKETAGHIGNGPADGSAASWWVAAPNEQDAKLYDDELIFHTDGSYTLNAYDFVLCNEAAAHNFGVTATESVLVPYTQPEGQEWYISKEGDKLFLTFEGGGFPSYIAGDNWGSLKYEIIELTETTLHIKVAFDWGAFFMRFKA